MHILVRFCERVRKQIDYLLVVNLQERCFDYELGFFLPLFHLCENLPDNSRNDALIRVAVDSGNSSAHGESLAT